MKMEIAWWDLDGSPATVESLEKHLSEDGVAHNWQSVEGLREKFWIADPEGKRWGAVMVWDQERPADLPENLAAALIGAPISHRDRFDVQATVRGEGLLRVRDRAHRYVVVDAFATEVLRGNPVAVFWDADDLTSDQMQRIAKEMNLSESVFLLSPTVEDADVRTRIFTPVNELPFAGHPLLGTAVAVGLDRRADHLRFETKMGVVPFEVDRTPAEQFGGGVAYISMEQPIPVHEPYEHAEALLEALGIDSSTLPVEIYRNGPRHVFVGLPDADALAALHPDHRALSAFPDMAANCFAPEGERWQTRMFSPAYGVVEDAATGSAAGPLAIHLARHGLVEYGKTIEIHQGVQLGRRAVMFAEATLKDDSTELDRVRVSGHGTVASEGTIHI
ncbi:PhzF family phenazine biosynthesis isomerase [Streptomyces sp. NA04227]|uniref:PhzF family phenazine biosynthesis protein n=1 Tax=Streptomyces sp. NA04227 TaxID=2742136 RepID=UPI0011629FD6|nr:PhzF family phenazine biosynthesis isomerase [Streptomyces sp. NA04227]QDJ94211.1 SpzF [Streptomyces sp.]QKW08094.1 PhzF family phenazine biosynthesis isomerase [Streptomyces sp. NA04227]